MNGLGTTYGGDEPKGADGCRRAKEDEERRTSRLRMDLASRRRVIDAEVIVPRVTRFMVLLSKCTARNPGT